MSSTINDTTQTLSSTEQVSDVLTSALVGSSVLNESSFPDQSTDNPVVDLFKCPSTDENSDSENFTDLHLEKPLDFSSDTITEEIALTEYPQIQGNHKRDANLAWTDRELKIKSMWSQIQSKRDKLRKHEARIKLHAMSIDTISSQEPNSLPSSKKFVTNSKTELVTQRTKKEKSKSKLSILPIAPTLPDNRKAFRFHTTYNYETENLNPVLSEDEILICQTARVINRKASNQDPNFVKKADHFIKIFPSIMSTLKDLNSEKEPLKTILQEKDRALQTAIAELRMQHDLETKPFIDDLAVVESKIKDFKTSIRDCCVHDFNGRTCRICGFYDALIYCGIGGSN